MSNRSNYPHPSPLATWVLERVADQTIRYSALGDFEEQFFIVLKEKGRLAATAWYWWQVLKSLPHFVWDSFYWSLIMLRNYLVVAFRNMLKQKVYSFINIFGLSLALALSILVFIYVRNEFSYDTFHEKSDKIFRVNERITGPRGVRLMSATALPICDELKSKYPEIPAATRLASETLIVKKGENAFNETVTFVDPDFFDIFSFPVLGGSNYKPLASLSSLVLSEQMANKYFGGKSAIGKELTIQLADSNHVFIVSAIVDNREQVSSIPLNFVANIEKTKDFFPANYFTSYNIAFSETYVLLSDQAAVRDLEAKFRGIIPQTRKEQTRELFLQPLGDIHLNTEFEQIIAHVSSPVYSYVLSSIGLLVLFVAAINFITLSIGRSTARAKEVGIRKVVGAVREQIVRQYLGETFITTTFALLTGVLIASQVLPFFNSLSGKQLAFDINPSLIIFLVAVCIGLGVIAGSYPALLLASYQPIAVLKGVLKLKGKGRLSRMLVVLQFSLSIFLIIGTLVMYRQIEFFRQKNLGYDKERVVDISMNTPADPQVAQRLFQRYKNTLLSDSQIVGVSASMNQFGVPWTLLKFEQEDGTSESIYFNQVDIDYLQALDIELVAGRNFSQHFSTDEVDAIIVNEALVRRFGWQDPIGEQIPGSRFEKPHKIIGVVRDFHFSSLHQEIKPLALALSFEPLRSGMTGLDTWTWPPQLNRILVRITAGETERVINFLRETWSQVAPQSPFEVTFLDAAIDAQYAEEQKWATIVNCASIAAILIASLGLFGLTSLTVERRIKEIGIRKVLGASVSSILVTVSKDLLVLVVFANLLAWPLAFFTCEQWLQDFAYRVNMSAWFFIISSVIALFIAALTTGSQTLKAAFSNPVDSLRTE